MKGHTEDRAKLALSVAYQPVRYSTKYSKIKNYILMERDLMLSKVECALRGFFLILFYTSLSAIVQIFHRFVANFKYCKFRSTFNVENVDFFGVFFSNGIFQIHKNTFLIASAISLFPFIIVQMKKSISRSRS